MTVRSALLDQVNILMRRQQLSLRRIDQLTTLADRFGSDKGTLFNAHGYTRVYSRLFERFKKCNIVFVEIGLHRFEADGRRQPIIERSGSVAIAKKAPSLQMWQEFFPHARIFGFDIDDFSRISIERCTILRGDMSSPDDLDRLVQAIGEPIDIAIEDASHASHHQQIALGHLFPYIRSGGMYIVEDLCWQPAELEKPDVPKTRDILRCLQVNGTFQSPLLSREQCAFIAANVQETLLFDSLTTKFADSADSLAVLIKK